MALGFWAKDYLGPHEAGGSGGGGVMVVPVTFDESTQSFTFQKTWKEIFDAIGDGAFVVGSIYEPTEVNAGQYTIASLYLNAGRYVLEFATGGNSELLSAYADTENDYPVCITN